MKRIYFQGLNEIRALAALAVLFHHVELYKLGDKMPSLFDTIMKYVIGSLGKNGVYLFFVLSGFLITYLLLSEKVEKGFIDYKKFYVRRILRIWPLYYLIVVISFAVPFITSHIQAFQEEKYYYSIVLKSNEYYYAALLLFLLFLPNLALATKKVMVGSSQAWSVGVEEQFYLIWPQVIQRTKKEFLLYLLLSISFIPLPFYLLGIVFPATLYVTKNIMDWFPIHFMSIGAVGAYFLFYHREKITPYLNNPTLFILNTLAAGALLIIPINKVFFGYAVMLEILFITQSNFRFNLRNKILDKMGEISYGIYMYHPLVMYCSFSFVNSMTNISNTNLFYHILIYILVIGITVIISQISYTFFEKRFVDLKNKKFTVISSGKE